jgi:hypothetical protein
MGYDAAKLTLLGQAIAGRKCWIYEDTGGEAVSAYQANGYFTDAKQRGVDTGDPITVIDVANSETWQGRFITLQDTGATTGTVRFDTGQP